VRIFLTGASGMLASEVAPELQRQGHEVLAYSLNPRLLHIKKLDITRRDDVLSEITKTKPDIVLHMAAATDVDRCQREPDYAFATNAAGTENVALACRELNIPIIYISTSAVFYGDKKTPYTEDDTPNPKNIYGQSKWQGEEAVRKHLSKFFIIRAGWMVGGWDIDKKFVFKIVTQIKAGKTELKAVSDKRGSPCFAKDFAKNLMAIVGSKRYGVYHLVNKGACSRYEMALKIVEFMGLKDKVKIEPVDSSIFPMEAPRPDSEMMENSELERLGLNRMPDWISSLEEYVTVNKNK
jgi:dTDP-4-dehydrorhamnose reductase